MGLTLMNPYMECHPHGDKNPMNVIWRGYLAKGVAALTGRIITGTITGTITGISTGISTGIITRREDTILRRGHERGRVGVDRLPSGMVEIDRHPVHDHRLHLSDPPFSAGRQPDETPQHEIRRAVTAGIGATGAGLFRGKTTHDHGYSPALRHQPVISSAAKMG